MTDGRTVLVFGGSSGIGLAAAVRLAMRHARLTLVSRDGDALAVAAERCRAAGALDVRTVTVDVLDADQVARAVDDAVAAFGELDAVIHTATVMAYGRVEDVPPHVFTTVVDTAVHGTLNIARAALAVFRPQGRGTVVVVNSLLGSITVPNMGAYATSKWGQRALVRTLQQEVRDAPDIHVCMVSPGSINTPIYYQAANYLGRAARPPVPVLQPERAGSVVADLVERPRQHVSVPVGPANPIVIAGFRLVPWLYDRIVGPLFRLGALTKDAQDATDGNVHRAVARLEDVHGHWPRLLSSTEVVPNWHAVSKRS